MNIPPELNDTLKTITTAVIPIILAVTLHEAAHGFAALAFGDDTAKRAGRISANPLHHIDPFGTVVLPAILLLLNTGMMFGYAKPVPVNYNRLVPQKLGIVLVALAGPMTNILLAILSAALLYAVPHLPAAIRPFVIGNIKWSFSFNLFLAVFNLLPVPPLDGGRVVMGLLPLRYSIVLARYERYVIFGLMLLMIIPYVGQYVFGILVALPANWLGDQIQTLIGLG